jgi:alkylation response protein AidB-like acyl-CoA dehydrogenase
MDGDAPRAGPDGAPVGLGVFFRASEVEIVDNWNTLGLRGTGSHDVRATDVYVPARRIAVMAPLDHPGIAYRGPLYRLGMWLDPIRIASTGLGIAHAALTAFLKLAQARVPTATQTPLADRPLVQDGVAHARAMIEAGRVTVYRSVEEAWAYVQDGHRITADEGISMGLASAFAVELAARAVDTLQGLAGTVGIREEQPFARYFRDVHTLNQHALASVARFESLGKLILGRRSDWPFHYL